MTNVIILGVYFTLIKQITKYKFITGHLHNMVYEKTIERREVLRSSISAAGAAGLLAGGVGIVGASNSSSMRGITYDTLTHKTGGEIGGNIQIDESGELGGSANIANFPLKWDTLDMVTNGGLATRYQAELSSPEFVRQGYSEDNRNLPLQVSLTILDDHISGVLKRPHGDFGKLGFVMAPDLDPSRMKKIFTPDEKWVNSPHTFEIPDSGIPTDSGLRNVADLPNTPPSRNGGANNG